MTTATETASVDSGTRSRMNEMRSRATAGFTPAKAKAGETGHVFFQLDEESCIVVQCRTYEGKIRVAVTLALGIAGAVGCVMWHNSPVGYWPNKAAYDAFQKWWTAASVAEPAKP